MTKQAGTIILIMCSAIFSEGWETALAQEKNTGRPSNYYEETENNPLSQRIEEIWLLTKLGRKKEARIMLGELIKEYPDNSEVLFTASSAALEKGDIYHASYYLSKLEQSGSSDKRFLELKARLFYEEGLYGKAVKLYGRLIEDYPDNVEYRLQRGYSLAGMRMWPKAREDILSLKNKKNVWKNILWDARGINYEGANSIHNDILYLHAPESLRQFYAEQYLTFWPHKNISLTPRVFEEQHNKRPLGTISGVDYFMPGYALEVNVYTCPGLSFNGEWEGVVHAGDDFHEMTIGTQVSVKDFTSSLTYRYNHLLRDPIDALTMNSRIDNLIFLNDIMVADILRLGYNFETQWYRVPKNQNTINGKASLGYKIFNEPYAELIFFKKPVCTFNVRFKHAHWDKSFEQANTLLDFIEDERWLYGGFTVSDRFWNIAEAFVSVGRSYDFRREFYSTYTVTGVDVWVNEVFKMTFNYELDYNVQGLVGSGNVQAFTAKASIMF